MNNNCLLRIGAHLPIGKGLKHTADEAVSKEVEAIQIFLRNPRGRGTKKLTEEEVGYFQEKLAKHVIYPLVVHIPYICNPAADKEELYQFAHEIVREDLARCDIIGADFLVLHPGSYTTSSLDKGITKIINLVNNILDDYNGKTMLLLETMAGQGTEVGSNFKELNQILNGINRSDKVGICYDTCHTFAAGYDCTNKGALDKVLADIDATFGRERIKLVHANDSAKELGSRRDRHAPIGEGFIGLDGFTALMSNEFFNQIPFVLETPFDNIDKDINTLKLIRKSCD